MQKRLVSVVSFSVLLISGLVVFVVFSHIRPMLLDYFDWIGRAFLIIILMVALRLANRSSRFKPYWTLPYAFLIAAVAMAIDLYLPSSKWLLATLDTPIRTPAGLALDKLDSSLIITLCIIMATKLSGASLGSIFLQKGHLRKGLTTGVIALLISIAGSIPVARLFGATDLSLARIWPWLPWIVLFIFGNALNEELLFRGLFLNKANLLMNKTCANLVLVLPFVLHHTGVTYTNDAVMFLAYLIPLAFAWGYIMQKTNSIWGSVLFHAGTDIPIVLVIFSQL